MSALNREEAFQALESVRTALHARISPSMPAKGRRYLGYVVDEQMDAARLHLAAIYEHGLAVGPDFAPVKAGEATPKYAFWLEGLRRHIESCEVSLGTPPGSRGAATA